MANKKELFKRMWVDINKRLPPNTEDEILIGFASGESRVAKGSLVCLQKRQMQDENFKAKTAQDKMMKLTGYFAIKWMKIHH